jgi:hypothetical protein
VGRIAVSPLLVVVLCSSRAAPAAPPLRLSAEGGVTRHVVGADAQRFVGVAAELALIPRALEVGLGGRVSTGGITPDPALSGLLRVTLCAWQPPYNPALGLELELGPGSRPHVTSAVPDTLERSFNTSNRDKLSWASVLLEPLRFEWGPYFVSGAGLRLGTPISGDSGRRVVVAVSVLRLGYQVIP